MHAALDGAKHRREFERDQMLSLAWHIERFARAKQLPSLEKLLGRETKKKRRATPEPPQSEAQMRSNIIAWAMAIGPREAG